MTVLPLGSDAERETVQRLRSHAADIIDLADTVAARNARINPEPATRVRPLNGLFTGGALFNTPQPIVDRARLFDEWLYGVGGAKTPIYIEFTNENGTWDDVSGSLASLDRWVPLCGVGKQARLCITWPLATKAMKHGAGLTDFVSGARDAKLAHFSDGLLRREMGDTIIRLGHEFNGDWYPWRAQDNPALYVRAYRYAVDYFRNRHPSAFSFVWNFNVTKQQIAWGEAWPGREYVDFVGVDCYDQFWGDPAVLDPAERWDRVLNGPWGLKDAAAFARYHGKPLCVPEWGVGKAAPIGGGPENPTFVDGMWRFLTDPANNVAWHAYWNRGAGSNYDGQIFPVDPRPQTAAKYKELFGA